MDNIILDKFYPASLESLSVIRANIQKSAQSMKLGQTNTENFQLAVTEIVTNLTKYPDEKPAEVHVKMGSMDSEVILEVYDNGSPFLEFNDLLKKTLNASENIFDLNTSSGGRGLIMLQMMFSRFEYIPKDKTEFNKYILANEVENIEQNKNPHILLIDDNELDLNLYEAYLSNDYLIAKYSNPEEALLYASNNIVDLILCDINMPSMMGTEFHSKLNELSDKGSTPFIFLSANKNTKVSDQIKNLAINDSITKPVEKDDLLDVVERVLKRHKHEMSIVGTRLDASITELISPCIPDSLGPYKAYYNWKSSEAGGGDILFHFPATKNQKNSITVIGDIMGHGEQAKFFSVSILGYLRGLIRANIKNDIKPNQILDQLSDALFYDEILERTMLTCLVISLDDSGNGYIANAGHIPPALIQNENIEIMDIYGHLLGLSSDQTYDCIPFSIQPNQKAIFVTDGLLEVGKKTLEIDHFIEQYKNLKSDEMIKKIFNALEDKLDDDALMLILEND